MDEILLFESTGSIEYFPDPETIEENTSVEIENEEQLEEDTEEQLEEDPEEQLEEYPEEQLEEDTEENIIEEQKEIKEQRKDNDVIQVPVIQNDIYTGDDPEYVSDYQIISVSENNIITKPLNDYSVSESLQLFIFISLFVAGFIVLVRRAVLKWS